MGQLGKSGLLEAFEAQLRIFLGLGCPRNRQDFLNGSTKGAENQHSQIYSKAGCLLVFKDVKWLPRGTQ
jgi:hypothetical protein